MLIFYPKSFFLPRTNIVLKSAVKIFWNCCQGSKYGLLLKRTKRDRILISMLGNFVHVAQTSVWSKDISTKHEENTKGLINILTSNQNNVTSSPRNAVETHSDVCLHTVGVSNIFHATLSQFSPKPEQWQKYTALWMVTWSVQEWNRTTLRPWRPCQSSSEKHILNCEACDLAATGIRTYCFNCTLTGLHAITS